MDRSSPLSASPDSRHPSPPRGGADRSSSPPRGLERGLIKLPEPLNNPHWRPPPDSRNPQWRRGDGDWRNGQNQGGAPSGWSGGPAQQPPSSGWCSAPSTPSGSHAPRGTPGLFDPKDSSRGAPGLFEVRERGSPPAPSFPPSRFPVEASSRFVTAPQPSMPGGGPVGPVAHGYRHPFPPRLMGPGEAFSLVKHLGCNWKFPSGPMVRPLAAGQLPPDWYDVYNSNIYGSGKIDINCIANIVRNDLRLKSVLQGRNFSHLWQTMMKVGPFCRDQISTAGLSFTESDSSHCI